ncbi:MAG: hypothetical protein JKY54_08135, partial [Flavobacteriales bacterium]|nr:hypothetical protein [Flavobacteriales bacterium]
MIRKFTVFLSILLVSQIGRAQFGPCDPCVPIIPIDLTGVPDSVWTISNLVRDCSCCGYNSPPNNCVMFELTLDVGAQGIMFNVTCGALPSNLEWQLMDPSLTTCDTILYPAATPVCLDGVGPHYIVFCKPGGNDNCYETTSIPEPNISPPQVIGDGCSGVISIGGYDNSTVVWNSVSPGAPGDYNSYLDCTFGCDTVYVTGQVGYPPSVDYEVCGIPAAACDTITVCEISTIYFVTTLFADIQPNLDTLCIEAVGTTLTAAGVGGSPPYSYLWSNGLTTSSISVTAGGTYWVEIS